MIWDHINQSIVLIIKKKKKKKKKINLLFFLTMDSNKDGIKIYEVDITKQGLG